MLLLCLLIFATIIGVNGQCSLEERPKLNNVCSADIICDGTTENMMKIVKAWNCIKIGRHVRYRDYKRYYEDELETNYNLYVNVNDVDIDISEDPLIIGTANVITLHIEKGNLVSIPSEVYSLVKLTKLSLTYNKIENINLSKISAGDSIKYLNVSHNCISYIEDNFVLRSVPSTITSIDLSYNELESISSMYYARLTQLKYLDISSNLINNINYITFDGMAQLETLKLSHNRLSEIGERLERLRNLKNLALDYNLLTSLTDLNFRTLISLEKLNLSSNLITYIEEWSLTSCTNLKQLDLSHNKIKVIQQRLFENNTNLYRLSLSYNDLQHIEGGTFKTNNISHFDIRNNHIKSINIDTFQGMSVESLDLSNGMLTELGDKAFFILKSNLRYLNISNNLIEDITESAFLALRKLLKLDLSFNNLIDIDFNTSDFNQLIEYYLQNNKIKKITRNMFRNMTNLVNLNLSRNEIVDIDLNSFIDLINLEELDISSNYLVQTLTGNIFQGLNRVKSLDLSKTRLMYCLNESFYGMASLYYLNVSHSQLETIEYETFKMVQFIPPVRILDLSHNVLKNFHINTTSISDISELYLNHNKLKNITRDTFRNLFFLQKLNLACNNILYIDSTSLKTLMNLRYLNLYSNFNFRTKGDFFNNLILSEVSLKEVRKQFSFKNAFNTSITTLILSHCEIEDINSVFVYEIKNVLKLDISSNKIKALDKGSFQDMVDLNRLDISFNMISTIQPGTFLSNNMINTLNLYGNNLQSLQFGVLDGLRNLRVLNLSNNEIHTFGVNLLHTTPHLTELFLENNNLANLDFEQLSRSSVELLTIGGNSISCDALLDWKKLNSDNDLNVTAEILDFNSENYYGIRCKTSISRDKISNESTNGEIIEIKQIVGKLYSSLNESISKIISFLEHVPENSDRVSQNSIISQQNLSEQLKELFNQNKNLLPQLVNTSDNVIHYIKLMISLLEINNNLTILSNIPKELFQNISVLNKTVKREYSQNSTNIVLKLYDSEPLTINLDKNTLADIKVLLYFIAVCFAIVILFCLVALTYKYLYRQFYKYLYSHRIHTNNLYDNGQSVRSGLEME